MTRFSLHRIFQILILLPLLFTSGCAIMSKADCVDGNWRQAGYYDADSGYSASRMSTRTRVCAKHGVTPNKVAYLLGYKEGVKNYCTAERGMTAGSRDRDYRGICPSDLEGPFLTQYVTGLKVARREVTLRSNWLEHELFDSRFLRIRTSSEHRDYERLNNRIDSISSRLGNLKTKRLQLNRKIARWSAHLQASSTDPKTTK